MNAVSSIASQTAAYVPTALQAGTNARAASGQDVPVTASPEAQISPQAKALAEFFEAASAFIQKEHFEPFTGWKRDSAGYTLNSESAYLDVEKYNNYLFDKAAATLVEQAKQLGLALDEKEVLAQLKADNAGIAAIKYSDAERVKYLKMCADVVDSNLSRSEVDNLTDLYIAAKENGLDASQVGLVAFHLGLYHHDGASVGELYTHPGMFSSTAEEIAAHEAERFSRFQNVIDKAGELKAKLSNVTFGFDDESGFFAQKLNPRIGLGGIGDDDFLSFLLKMADLYAPGATTDESWTWSPSTGWTTDPDSREAAAARSAYEAYLAKTAADLEKYFGDKADKTGKTGNAAASSPDESGVSGELAAALDRLAQEKELLAQLLRPLNRPANDEEQRSALPRLDAAGTTLTPGHDRLRPSR